MHGTERVIGELNDCLNGALSAIVQCIVHAEMLHCRGYEGRSLYVKKQAIEEMLHARSLIERILVLEGLPQVDLAPSPRIGVSCQEQLGNDLAAERRAVGRCSSAAAICAHEGDTVSQALLERIVRNKEAHAGYLAAELSAQDAAGLGNCFARQIHSVPRPC